MTHVEDLYEPGDDREPSEPEQEPPLSLEEIEAAHALTFDKSSSEDPYQAITLLLEVAVPQMVADLREARQRIAEWEALPTREEWTVTDGSSVPPGSSDSRFTADAAMSRAARDGKQAWRQVVALQAVLRPWEPIADKGPF